MDFDTDIYKVLAEIPDDEKIPLGVHPQQLFTIIAQLQLALRHPGNTGESAIATREMVKRLIEILEEVVPGTKEILETGWLEEFDITKEYFEDEFS